MESTIAYISAGIVLIGAVIFMYFYISAQAKLKYVYMVVIDISGSQTMNMASYTTKENALINARTLYEQMLEYRQDGELVDFTIYIDAVELDSHVFEKGTVKTMMRWSRTEGEQTVNE